MGCLRDLQIIGILFLFRFSTASQIFQQLRELCFQVWKVIYYLVFVAVVTN